MQIRLTVLGEIEVDYHIHTHDVNTTSEQIGAHEATSLTSLEIVIDSIQKRQS